MKIERYVLSGIIILLAGLTVIPVKAQQKHGTATAIYQLDIKKSKLLWKASKNRHYGFILFNSGTLSNPAAGWPTRGTISINMNSMKSLDEPTAAGRKNVDDKLRSEDFFAVSKYPTATMVVKQILPQHQPSAFKVLGELTIKGITHPIEFTAVIKQKGSTITATAQTSISRQKWNINHIPQPTPWDIVAQVKDNLVDNDISVGLELVFTKKQL